MSALPMRDCTLIGQQHRGIDEPPDHRQGRGRKPVSKSGGYQLGKAGSATASNKL
jgi:hypothetical protein